MAVTTRAAVSLPLHADCCFALLDEKIVARAGELDRLVGDSRESGVGQLKIDRPIIVDELIAKIGGP